MVNFLICDRMCHTWMLLLTCQSTTNLRICWILRRGCQALIACHCTLSLPSPPQTLSGTIAPLPHPVKVSCLDSILHLFLPLCFLLFQPLCLIFTLFYIVFLFSSFFYKVAYFHWYNSLFCTRMTVVFKIVYMKDEDSVSECSIICDHDLHTLMLSFNSVTHFTAHNVTMSHSVFISSCHMPSFTHFWSLTVSVLLSFTSSFFPAYWWVLFFLF